jgi:hypothetical protein
MHRRLASCSALVVDSMPCIAYISVMMTMTAQRPAVWLAWCLQCACRDGMIMQCVQQATMAAMATELVQSSLLREPLRPALYCQLSVCSSPLTQGRPLA